MNVVVAFDIDAVTNKLPVFTDTAEPVFTVKLNVEPSPLVKVKVLELTLPVTIKLPVLAATAEPVATVTVNCELSPFVNVITLLAAEAVVNNEAVDTVVPAFKANEAVVANDDDIACDEVIARLPVILFPKPSCNSLPLICVRN